MASTKQPDRTADRKAKVTHRQKRAAARQLYRAVDQLILAAKQAERARDEIARNVDGGQS